MYVYRAPGLPGALYSTLTYNQPATRFISMIQYCIYCIQLYTVVSPHISSTLTYHGTPDFPPKKRIKILKSFSMAERTNTAYLDWVTPTGVAVLSLDHYPVNSLSSRVVNALARAIRNIEAKWWETPRRSGPSSSVARSQGGLRGR